MKKIIITFAIALVLILAATLAGIKSGSIQRFAGNWLVVSTKLEKTDVIYVYAGGIHERPGHGSKLYKQGLAEKLVVGGILIDQNLAVLGEFQNEGTLNRKLAEKHGVPEEDIIQLWDGTSTYEETVALKQYMTEKNHKSVILVTSPFHTRRVKFCAEKVFKGTGIHVMVSPVENSLIDPDTWWHTEMGLITVFTEYVKLGLYYYKY